MDVIAEACARYIADREEAARRYWEAIEAEGAFYADLHDRYAAGDAQERARLEEEWPHLEGLELLDKRETA